MTKYEELEETAVNKLCDIAERYAVWVSTDYGPSWQLRLRIQKVVHEMLEQAKEMQER